MTCLNTSKISRFYVMSLKACLMSGAMLLGVSTTTMAQTRPATTATTVSSAVSVPTGYAQFTPKPWTDKRGLNYGVWDDILQKVVIDFGISARIRATKPVGVTGTRTQSGHASPYRLEGSRVAFGYFTDNYQSGLAEYREDLERIANQIDLTRLSRDEQLAFWFNLHNVTVVEQIAKAYPEEKPSAIKIDGVPLHDAKILNIRGQALSLRDIRQNIVYANWRSPLVIYGFFHGDIGSPRLPRLAYTSDSLEFQLNGNANEFVNSLRGMHKARKSRKVSAIYDEAKDYYFQNWESDLDRHLRKHAEEQTLEDLNEDKPFELDKYETKIADLSGGRRVASGLALSDNLNPAENSIATSLPAETLRLLAEVGKKQRILQQRGYYTGLQKGYVVIEDIETDPNQKPAPGSTIR